MERWRLAASGAGPATLVVSAMLFVGLLAGCPSDDEVSGDGDVVVDVGPGDALGDGVVVDAGAEDAAGDVGPDAIADVGPDAIADVGPDAIADVGPDAIADVGPDAIADVGPDAIADVGPDAIADVGPDAIADVGPDIIADVGPDIIADAGPDVAVDAGPDAGDAVDAGPDAGDAPPAEPQFTAQILSVEIVDGVPLVTFSVLQDGAPYDEVVAGEPRFAIAKLVPGEGGDPDRWQSYINQIEEPGDGPWPGMAPAIQATTELGGVLQSLGGGTYTYTFETDLDDVTEPLAVPYEPTLTHRLGLELRGGLSEAAIANPVYTWQPSTGMTEGILTRDIATTESCNECHGRLEAHGGPRNQVQYCVVCHNPGTTDANSGRVLDLSQMIHKLHRGEDLPSVQAGEPYVVWGFDDTAHDYSEVVHPQDIRNCAKCHTAQDAATPEGDAWKEEPSIAACQSCHDDIAFVSPPPEGMTLHTAGPQAGNGLCSVCHGPALVEASHTTPFSTPHNPGVPPGFPVIGYELHGVSMVESAPVVTFTVRVDDVPIDLATLPEGLGFGTYGPSFRVAYSLPEGTVETPADFNNTGNGQPLAQPVRTRVADILDQLTQNVDGSYTTAAGALGSVPEGAQNVAVAMEGAFAFEPAPGEPTVSIAGDGQALGVGGPFPRRQVVAIDKCNACHERLALHGGHRVNDVDLCVTCHNPNATDRAQRPEAPVDGLQERPIAFGPMIHAIHMGEALNAEQYVLYGFGQSVHDYAHVRYPADRRQCAMCHVGETVQVPLVQGALAVSVLTGADLEEPLDDSNVSPAGAACTGCHDSAEATAHAKVTEPFYDTGLHGTENDDCVTCHGPGAIQDVTEVHDL